MRWLFVMCYLDVSVSGAGSWTPKAAAGERDPLILEVLDVFGDGS